MRVVYPETIVLESGNILADSDGYSEWSDVTTYAIDNMVMVTTATPHKIYKSLANSNTNNAPATSPLKWQDQGGTNRWKMFDEFIDTQSSNAELIRVTVEASNCDRFALFNLDAYEVEIELIDNDVSASTDMLLISPTDELLISTTDTLAINRTSVMSTLYDLDNGDGTYRVDLVGPIYLYNNASLKIEIRKSGGTAKCGIAIVGKSEEIGTSMYGVKPGILDYSIKDTDEFGRTFLSQGAWAKDLDLQIFFPWGSVDYVFDALVAARGKLVVVECNGTDTDYEALNIYGFFREWEIDMASKTHEFCSINFQGVI